MKIPLPKPIEDVLTKQDIFIKALFERPESLSKLLPYEEYLSDKMIFRQKDGSLGAVYAIELLEHETMTSEAIVESVLSVKPWFTLPENCVLQVLFDQYRVSSLDDEFKNLEEHYKNPHPLSKTIFDNRLNTIRDACAGNDTYAPLRRIAYLSVRYFPNERGSNLWRNLLKPSEALLFNETKSFIQEQQDFLHILGSFESKSRVPLKRLGGGELLDFLRRFFNPKRYYKRKFAAFNPNTSISDQIIYNQPTLDYNGIEREGIKTRTLSLKTSPQFAYPGGMAYFTRLPFPFKISLSFSFPSKSQAKRFYDMKEFFLQNTPSARAKRQKSEILEVQDRLASGDRCVFMTFNVIIEGETDEILDQRTQEVVNVFHHDLECETIEEEDIGLGLCLNSLPLNYIPISDGASQRFVRVMHTDATKFVPIFDSFRGLQTPQVILLSRENNIARFSLFDNPISNHTVVLGDTGSGKSAFMIACLQSAKLKDPEPLVFVIDKKSSYTVLSEYFDGNFTKFERDKEIPFSPFRGQYDEEKIAFLSNLILSAIKLTSPSFSLESEHTSITTKALKLAYAKKVKQAGLNYVEGKLLQVEEANDVQLSMDDFVSELGSLPAEKEFESLSTIIDQMVHKLRPFYGDGMYAKYFRSNPKTKKEKESLLYVYDLDALDADKTLQALMSMSVIEEIRQTIKLPQHQGRGGLIYVEEIGMLGRDNPVAKQFIIDAAETFRKLGYFLVSLTPNPKNYFELEAGQAMWSAAQNFVFLEMHSDNVSYLESKSTLLDEASSQVIRSLRTIKGQYAEIFYLDKKKAKQGTYRYIQTPIERWLAPTNDKDLREFHKAMQKFKDQKWKALEYLTTNFPSGVL